MKNNSTNLTFKEPCIMIYCYNKTNKMHYFSNLFWYRILHVSDRFTFHHQESSTVYTSIEICHTGYADFLLSLDLAATGIGHNS